MPRSRWTPRWSNDRRALWRWLFEGAAWPEAENPDKRLYLDDLHVGQRFTSRTHVIDAAQIKAFAGQFDPQPFHLDDGAAQRTIFAGLAASGWHTAAITMRLMVETGLPLAGGIIGAGGEAPAKPTA